MEHGSAQANAQYPVLFQCNWTTAVYKTASSPLYDYLTLVCDGYWIIQSKVMEFVLQILVKKSDTSKQF